MKRHIIYDVSIIMPAYNSGKLLTEAVNSCLDTDGVSVQVIVVDDGGSDGSIETVENSHPDLMIVRGAHRGASAARNQGLALASGRFIKFLDSDDLLAPGALKAQVVAIDRSGADVVYGDFEFTGNMDDPRIGGEPFRGTGEVEDVIDALLGDWWCANFCYLYRREAIAGLFWDEHLGCLQDFAFILNVALRGGAFLHQPGVTGYYRMHGGQITNSSMEKYAVNRSKILGDTLVILNGLGQLTSRRRMLIAHGYWSAARAFYRFDRTRFDEAVADVYRLEPGFSPKFWAPPTVRILTAIFGIRRAERMLGLRRNIVKALK